MDICTLHTIRVLIRHWREGLGPVSPPWRTLITPIPGVLPVLTCGSAESGFGPRN